MCRRIVVYVVPGCVVLALLLAMVAGRGPLVLAQDASTTRPTAGQPTPEQILEELRRQPITSGPIMHSVPGGRVMSPPGDRPSLPAAAGEEPLLPDGYVIAKRRGRIVRQGQWWSFAFESDGKARQDPPMRLLPCRQLELMEATSAGGTRNVVFVVTGRVTSYHGGNYLLPEVFWIVYDMGNFE